MVVESYGRKERRKLWKKRTYQGYLIGDRSLFQKTADYHLDKSLLPEHFPSGRIYLSFARAKKYIKDIYLF